MSEADSNWDRLGESVQAGQLYLDPNVAQQCAQRCSEFVARLMDLQLDAQGLTKVDGFGTRLRSGVALAAKSEKKAAGGDYSLDRAIADHIEVVEKMQRLFEQIGAKFISVEESGTTRITSAGAPLPG
ncbi:hypothetical protein FK531_20300 [Rhodococcus spelaei]|uniref:Uncharacterized protein n=1 Tax=Rhodococcus spelaei TaxID=2546320 RepID=A0A541B0C3_9NOCA|nr:hypothetical protein [Rhodococcus spelaei]TQF65773.1 hypothetical protein FK531_20300 [Rhodococcus spelaei]